jgi:hypothetical protein
MLRVDREEITVKKHEVGARLLRGSRTDGDQCAECGGGESGEMHGSSGGRRISDE